MMGAQRYGLAVLALLFVTLIYSVMDAQKRSAMLIVSPGMVDPIADKGGCSVSPNALLRIVPMGDSITEGSGSTDYNGYRLPLHDLLMANCSGRTVEYIGTQLSGTPPPGSTIRGLQETEGYSGYSTDHFLAKNKGNLTTTLARKPNAILLHIGTNDASPLRLPTSPKAEDAPKRLEELIDLVLSQSPTAVLLVAQIIYSPNWVWKDNIVTYNRAIPDIVQKKARKGYKVIAVDMTSIGEDCVRDMSGSPVECDDLIDDGVHPKDHGYQKMARMWYKGLAEATRRGYFK